MKYNTKNPYKKEQLLKKVQKDIEKGETVEYKTVKAKRTIPQNALYWVWCNCVAQDTGHTDKEIHKHFAGKFLGFENKEILGIIQSEPISTTTQDTRQFSEYMDKIHHYSSEELGIVLLKPGEENFLEFYKEYC